MTPALTSTLDIEPLPGQADEQILQARRLDREAPDADTSVASIRHRSAADATLLTDLESTFDLQYAA